MTKQADLVAYLFEGYARRDDPAAARLSSELLRWMDASSRFTAFVETYRDKIRKKIRVAREAESILDLRSELEVAAGLLADSRMAVAYEPYASAKRRGPDFAVTYRANTVFNIEVARIRIEADHRDTNSTRIRVDDDDSGGKSRSASSRSASTLPAKKSASCASCWISWGRCSPACPTCWSSTPARTWRGPLTSTG